LVHPFSKAIPKQKKATGAKSFFPRTHRFFMRQIPSCRL
jgi:hypothetical protein